MERRDPQGISFSLIPILIARVTTSIKHKDFGHGFSCVTVFITKNV
jgi:hypothetical protein